MPFATQRRRFLGHAMAAAGTIAMPSLWPHAQAAVKLEKWPLNNLKIIVPYPAGGGVDTFCRKVADLLSPRIGVPVVVQNTAGAAGLVGSRAIAMAPNDGSTVGYVHSGIGSLQAMGAKIDLLNDFTPVAPRMQASTFLFVVNSESSYKSLGDLIAALKANPTKLTYGTAGLGSPEHVIFEKLMKAVPGIGAVHIPYKGTIEGVAALMGKQIDFMVCITSTARAGIEGGKLRALAVASASRSKLFPDIPTVAEAGAPGFVHTTWSGIFGPRGVPPQLVEQLRAALLDISRDPSFTAFVINSGAEPLLDEESPQEFRNFLMRSLDAETKLMKQLNLKV